MTNKTHNMLKGKVATYGFDVLSDSECLALATGLDRCLLQPILDQYTLYEIGSQLDAIDLDSKIRVRLEALFQLQPRINKAQYRGEIVIRCPEDIGPLFVRELQFKTTEVVMVALLNARNRLIRIETVAIGGISSAMIDPREIARIALRYNASSVAMAHNHPSSCTEPSSDDVSTAINLSQALRLLNIRLIDAFVIVGPNYTSLKQVGKI